jgi:hypothetical protein
MNLNFLSPECQKEFIEIFGSSDMAIDFYIHSYVEYKSKGGEALTSEQINAIHIARDVIHDRRNNIYGMSFIFFPKNEFGKEWLSMYFEFEEVDPEYWEDKEGNIHSTFDTTLKAVQKALPNYTVKRNCGGIDVRLK